MRKFSTLLSVTAHPDDEVLGYGGTAAILSSRGHHIHNLILSGEVNARTNRPTIADLHVDVQKAQSVLGTKVFLGSLPNMQFNTIPHLELVENIERSIEEIQPDYIFTHHPGDLNNDHHHVSLACQAACRLFQRKQVKRIQGVYLMEVPSSTDWSFPVGNNQFAPNTFFEIGEEGLSKKLDALASYRGVMRDFPHSRSAEALRGLAAYRGGQSGYMYAEAFQVIFQTLPLF